MQESAMQTTKPSNKAHAVIALLFRYLPSFVAGGLMVFAFAPFSIWPLTLLCVSFWLTQLRNQPPKHVFYQGLVFGFGWFSVGISWVHVSIAQFGGMPLIISLLLMALLCLYLALYPALAAWCSAKFTRQQQINLYYLPFFWLLAEYCRAHFLTGFPWLSLGYSQIDSPLSALAPIVGETGITFCLMLLCVSSVNILYRRHILANTLVIATIALSVLVAGAQTFTHDRQQTVSVALVQGNIKQELRWDEEQEQRIIDLYVEMTTDLYTDHQLIIWPEAAIPRLEPLAQDTLMMLDQKAVDNNSSLITGVINFDIHSKSFFNRLLVLGKKHPDDISGDYYYRNANHYDKHHLLPIGEFVPFEDLLRPIAPLFNLPMSSFSRGDFSQTNIMANGLHIAPLICFEIAFPKQLAANINEQTDVLLTVSNDAWFGDSHGPHQHLEIARMRALEFGLPMLRATNNGLTALIDHKGEISADIAQFEQAILSNNISLVTSHTPYRHYANYLYKVILALFLFGLFSKFIYFKYRANANV
ncbi:apolipoprotein N-acyltransferase [Thalassotalea aquiviva]|uniref:apolipoprotein N-acyltransferase n=1 Tax=Thalassotalea aquiviva TaxID=3242415 RepID=UPI00352AEAF1